MTSRLLGVIGGSGLYDVPGIKDGHWESVASPFGAPSDEVFRGTLEGTRVVFLPRHGRGHVHAPSDINFRANIDVMKRLGVTDLLSLSACGSLSEDLPPGAFVRVDQFIDRTVARQKSFFGSGCVAHVSMAEPVCNPLGQLVMEAGRDMSLSIHDGGTYLAMEGPQFSPRAEAELYRSWGCDVVGMTNMPEAKLAREAEICYVSIAMVTDYDCWHPDHGAVQVADVIRILQDNADRARQLVRAVAGRLAERPDACEQGCDRALEAAIMTAPEKRDPAMVARLDAVAGRLL